MRNRVIAGLLLLAAGSAFAAAPTPLLDYALAQTFEPVPRDFEFKRRLAYIQHELQRYPPPQTGCAQTLGAGRFARMYGELGAARSGLGDYEAAVEAYENALACTPRSPYLLAELAAELLHLNRYIEARAIAEQGLSTNEGEDSLNRLLAQLDYIEEHWSDAEDRLRTAVTATKDNDYATYWQCLLWLAQRRAGIEHPQLVSRETAEQWPQAILATLTGGITENQLIEEIADEASTARRREILEEALYYIGEQRLADGDLDGARHYLAAAVNLKVPYFLEHHLALAELSKMRNRTVIAAEDAH